MANSFPWHIDWYGIFFCIANRFVCVVAEYKTTNSHLHPHTHTHTHTHSLTPHTTRAIHPAAQTATHTATPTAATPTAATPTAARSLTSHNTRVAAHIRMNETCHTYE